MKLAIFLLLFVTKAYCSDPCDHALSKSNPQLSSAVTTTEILSEILAFNQKRERPNPYLIDVETLELEQDVFLDSKLLKDLEIQRELKSKPIKMRVTKIKEVHPGRRAKSNFIYLHSAKTGTLVFELFQLEGKIYSSDEILGYTPFVEGEYVQIGTQYSTRNSFKQVHHPTDTADFYRAAAPYIGKFVGRYDDKNFVVSIQSAANNLTPLEIIVPEEQTFDLITGTITRFNKRNQKLLALQIPFIPGEMVRYRNSFGLVNIGTFIQAIGQDITIKTELGSLRNISSQSVFKNTHGNPFTPTPNAKWIEAEYERPSGLVRQLLDGAGKLSSFQDFEKMTQRFQIWTLMKYLGSNVTSTKAALSAENAGLVHFNDIVCSGAGVCRHLVVLLTAMLSEAGFMPKIVKADGKIGHAWLEVPIRLPGGQAETLIVDPSNGNYILNYDSVLEIAPLSKDSFESKWYINPLREYLILQPEPLPTHTETNHEHIL